MIVKPAVLVLLALNAAWTFALVAVPFAVPEGTVRGLDGRTNVVDYWPAWQALPWYAAAAYAFGDLNCHQMETRSLVLHGNQLPVDARMTGMFVAANLGLLGVLALPTRPRARDMAVGLLPATWRPYWYRPGRRRLLLAAIPVLGGAPALVDWGLQLLTAYESTNLLRLLTGSLLGFSGALWVGLLYDSLLAPRLPGFPAAPLPRES